MLFAFIIERNWVQLNYLFGLGSTFLISGFILTESYLVLNGLGYTAMYEFLLLGSVAMALGILLIIISTIKKLFHE